METLKQRAKEAWDVYEYQVGHLHYSCFTDGFVAGVKSERAELLRWRTLTEGLPISRRLVLVQHGKRQTVSLVLYHQDQDGYRVWKIVDSNRVIQESSILGWRPVCDI